MESLISSANGRRWKICCAARPFLDRIVGQMSKQKKSTNPFYVVLVIAGVSFLITAFAYFTLAVREASPSGAASSNLMTLVGRYGLLAMIVELAILAVAT